jgi:hypothetical protein
MVYLYRGVNKDMDLINGGLLLPAGSTTKVVMLADGKWKCDGTIIAGECEHNAARAHQKDGGLYDAAGVSTTRSVAQALSFATYAGQDGYVYVLDEEVLAELGVVMKEFPDPEHLHEEEVTLLIADLKPVPRAAIIHKIEVLDGKPTRPIPRK